MSTSQSGLFFDSPMFFKKTFQLSSLAVILALALAMQIQMPYGLDEPEAIAAYLNNTFPDTEPEASAGIPQLLSETGAFADLATLEPSTGLIPYSLNQPFWSDGAKKFRWIAIPNDGTHDTSTEQITFSEDGVWAFPPGTVVVKHFELPTNHENPAETQRLETRFLVITADSSVYGFTYKWNDDQTDAELLEEGLQETLAVRTPAGIEFRTWEYPDRTMCGTCHTTVAGKIIGPRTRQLNGDLYYEKTDRTANQLTTWNHLGMFSEVLDENEVPSFLTTSPQTDLQASLDNRARSYLDSNCGYCHRPGSLRNALFDARLATPIENTGMLNGFAFNNLSILGGAIIVPGDTSKSLIYQRMRSLENQVAMPPLAKHLVDSAGVALIEQWILSLGSQTSTDESGFNHRESRIIGNYPNPFAQRTTITYELSAASPVEVILFDTRGNAIKTLEDSFQPAGVYTVSLSGQDLASGVYYVHLSTKTKSSTWAITLIK